MMMITTRSSMRVKPPWLSECVTRCLSLWIIWTPLFELWACIGSRLVSAVPPGPESPRSGDFELPFRHS
jgi:hypothetical protein